LPRLESEWLEDDVPLVVFHSMVRIHVSAERRGAFDEAISGLGGHRRLLHVSFEASVSPSTTGRPSRLTLHYCRGPDRDLAVANGHGRWIRPLRSP
jgi:hypothetical protein